MATCTPRWARAPASSTERRSGLRPVRRHVHDRTARSSRRPTRAATRRRAAGTGPTAPTAEGGALRAQSIRRAEGTGPAVLNGTLLRLNPTTRRGRARATRSTTGDGANNQAASWPTASATPSASPSSPAAARYGSATSAYNTWEEVDRVSAARHGSGTAQLRLALHRGAGTATTQLDGRASTCAPASRPTRGRPVLHLQPRRSAVGSARRLPATAHGSSISGVAFYEGAGVPEPSTTARSSSATTRATASGPCCRARTVCPTRPRSWSTSSAARPGQSASPARSTWRPARTATCSTPTSTAGRSTEISYATPQAVITSDVTSGVVPLTVALRRHRLARPRPPPLDLQLGRSRDGTFGDSHERHPDMHVQHRSARSTSRLRVTDAN